MSRRAPDDPLRLITEEIDGALALLGESAPATGVALPDSQRLGSLMEQCIRLCAEGGSVAREPVRTLHHFACTGGTLISKCVAAMPNVQLLSEVNPFSTLNESPDKPRFAPTDLIRLMRQSTRGVEPRVIMDLFLDNLRIIHRDAGRQGFRLVLRDHAHSHYCSGQVVADQMDLRAMLAADFDLRSVLTVRHPLQSWLSLLDHRWHQQFQPSTLDEYCRRYLAFLDDHDGVPVVQYEQFLVQPEQTMRGICEQLDLPFSDQFPLLFAAFKLTGDSGRTSDRIEVREPKPVPEAVAQAAERSANYAALVARLNYD